MIGCALLLLAPNEVFEQIVPFLVLGATAILAFQDRLRRLVGHPHLVSLGDALRERAADARKQAEQVIEASFTELAPQVGVKAARQLRGKPRSTHYRRQRPAPPRPRTPRPAPPSALSPAERDRVTAVLHSGRFVDKSPAQVWATLLAEGIYLCSESTMYRVLRERGEVRERRRQAQHPPRVRPELVAHHPNEVWSWDITKLSGPHRGVYYDLYVMIDIYSRYVVGWQVAARESSLLAELNIDRSHSRPRVSNDNPYSESQFKTLKHCPAFPDRFGSIADARAFCDRSSPTTTTSTGTAASGCTHRYQSTSALLRRSAPSGPRSSTLPTRPTRTGSVADPHHHASLARHGSTNHQPPYRHRE